MPDDAYAVNPTDASITVSDGTSQTVPAFSMKKVDVTTWSNWLTAGCSLVPLTTTYNQRRRLASTLRYAPALANSASFVAASVQTAVAGTNNDMVYTSKLHTTSGSKKADGKAGNRITIAYTMPPDTNQVVALALSMAVSEDASGRTTYAITCRLAVAADGSTVTTTAAALKTAIEANAAINAVVGVANAAANDGTGLLAAMAAVSLASGAGSVYERVEG